MATLPSPDEVSLPGRVLFRSGVQSQIAGAALRLGEGAVTTDNWWGHLGDESANPPAWPTNKTLGDFDWTNLDPRFNNINVKTINHLDPQSWIYQYITGNATTTPVITVITTNITKTVYGAGADFANFDAAYAWLSQRTISSTGSVTLNLPAGRFFINKRLTFAHPNGNRIYIKGQPLNQALPAENTLQISGSTVTVMRQDTAVNLARLRQSYSTELSFTNGGGIDCNGDVALMVDILMTADESIPPGLDAGNLLTFNNSNAGLLRCAVVGSNFCGLYASGGCSISLSEHFYSFGHGFSGVGVQVGSVMAIAGNFAACSNGFLFDPAVGTGGLVIAYGSVFYGISFLNTKSYIVNLSGNVGAGLVCTANGSFSNGTNNTVVASLNSVAGFQLGAGSNGSSQGAVLTNNGTYGVFVASLSQMDVTRCTIVGSQYGVFAAGGSQAYRTNSTINGQSVAALSPALGVIGNSNALIT